MNLTGRKKNFYVAKLRSTQVNLRCSNHLLLSCCPTRSHLCNYKPEYMNSANPPINSERS